MHYYRHEIGHFRAATAQLTNAQRYAYLELIWTYYDKEVPLPDNPRKLALRIGAEQSDVELVLEIYFTLEDDGWHNKKCDEVLAEYRSFIDQKSAAGKASGRARVERPSNDRSTTEQPNQLTTNQLTSTVQPKKVERTSKKPAVFVPPDLSEVIEYFRVEKLNGDPEHFCDHHENCDWRLSGGRGKKMKNWKLAAKNWSRNQRIFDPNSGGHKNGKLQLPKNRDGWLQFAEIHDLPRARSGESFDAWEGRLRSEIEKRSNQ